MVCPVDREKYCSSFPPADFAAFVALKIQNPILITPSVPESKAEEPGQLLRGKAISRVVPTPNGVEFNLAGANRR